MSFVVNDKRGSAPAPKPVCRVCGCSEEHADRYGTPTMKCIEYLRAEINRLEEKIAGFAPAS